MVLESHGFKRSHAYHYLCTKNDEDGNPIILVLYIDDMLLVGKKKSTLNGLKRQLNSPSSMKDIGEVEHILGMRLKRDRRKYTFILRKAHRKSARQI